MSSTFWTLIEDKYYRVHNGILKVAPIGNNNSVVVHEQNTVEFIELNRLNLINEILGCDFKIDDFKN